MTGPVARALALATVAVGVAMVVSALVRGAGPLSVGVVGGVLFCLAGAGRLYVEARR